MATWLVPILVALIMSLPGIWSMVATLNRRQVDATTSSTYAEAAKKMGENYTAVLKELDDLRTDFAREKAERECLGRIVNDWQRGIDVLLGQLIGARIEPAWKPTPISKYRKDCGLDIVNQDAT